MKSSEHSDQLRLLASDLDGTLLSAAGFHPDDLAALNRLGDDGVVRVIATGRNLHFAREALAADFPIDYLVFASGAGIARWPDGALLRQHSLAARESRQLIDLFNRAGINFMLHQQIPDEHHFYFQQNCPDCGDFTRRLAMHRRWGTPLAEAPALEIPLTQALAFIPAVESRFNEIASALPQLKVIRTSSPFGSDEIWIEIFPAEVSKGAAVEWLCSEHQIGRDQTVGIGNDYNDIDLLESTARSFIITTAPEKLHHRFTPVPAEAGLHRALQSLTQK